MIPRYSRPEMTALWTDEARWSIWLRIELAACKAWAKLGKIPRKDLQTILKKADFDPKRIPKIEAEVKHDVIAFLTSVAEKVGPSSRYIHLGMTSSDVLDTTLACQLTEALDLIVVDVKRCMVILKRRAQKYRMTPMMGRSHGIHAEPVTFGLKLALWYSEFERNLERLQQARKMIAVGKISGAVGTFANVPPAIEKAVCTELGLKPEPLATQVVQRDRHAQYFTTLAVLAGTIEKIAVEIRHLQRTEVLEVEEPFTKGQKGSSAMPHKRNPILSENLTGLARLVRANSVAAMENIALWHERDISHSSVERVIGPDSTILVDFMLSRLAGLLDGMVVYPRRMASNMQKSHGLIFSQRVLLALIEAGMSREEAYRVVQKNAMKAWDEESDFKEFLKKDPQVSSFLTDAEIGKLFDLRHHLKHVDTLFKRVFGSGR
ncbi:MAG: adenylosuccinate lyase [Deltaproteobacteria bacterium CG11_big_fil_rev_8_21_14_0_20_47_16]|nr:MAG: adenylosuccinate lyase [Deltaproteobacteria bacterium CG11_big_fil_rev_8_21_14_0_20_47_16]